MMLKTVLRLRLGECIGCFPGDASNILSPNKSSIVGAGRPIDFRQKNFAPGTTHIRQMTYIEVSNDIFMTKNKRDKFTNTGGKRAYVMGKREDVENPKGIRSHSVIKDKSYAVSGAKTKTFSVVREGGKRTSYTVSYGFGYFIPVLKKAGNVGEVAQFVEAGFRSKEVRPLIEFLEFKVPDIAKAAAVSSSTVSRWLPTTSIGVTGSEQFFKIDEIVRKGVDLFGGEEEFKQWLDIPNIALGNITPLALVKTRLGADMVDEALDALDYGDVM